MHGPLPHASFLNLIPSLLHITAPILHTHITPSSLFPHLFVPFSNVGYANRDLVRGEYNYCVANFLPMGKDKEEMCLGDLKFNENFRVSELQILEDGGNTMLLDWADYPLIEHGEEDLQAIFDYVAAKDAGAGGEGWYLAQDGDFAYNMNEWLIPFGWQFVIDCGDRNAQIIGNGEVDRETEEFDLERGVYNYLGNCTPCKMTLGDLILGANFRVSELQILEDGGNTMVLDWEEFPLIDHGDEDLQAIFGYVAAKDAGEGGAGWYLAQDGEFAYNMNEWLLESGDGFVIDCGDRNASIIVPSALPAEEAK